VTGNKVIEVVLATHNEDKIREIKGIFSIFPGIRILGSDELPDWGEVEETGESIEENAEIKALAVAGVLGRLTLADDTALEVRALSGAPGVYSSRYAGEKASYADNYHKLLTEMKSILPSQRQAVFRTAVAAAEPGKVLFIVQGKLEGAIASAPRGENGFGYDPVFYLPPRGKTLAELTLSEKNCISHRYRAFMLAGRKLEDMVFANEL
jgi:XTP/dITP diphosphohydrolase